MTQVQLRKRPAIAYITIPVRMDTKYDVELGYSLPPHLS